MPALVQPAVSSINVDDPSIAFEAARRLKISGVVRQPGERITLGELAEGPCAKQIALQMCRTGYLRVIPAFGPAVQPASLGPALETVAVKEQVAEEVLDLASLTIAQLRAKCRSLQLKTDGSKRDLQKRLESVLG